MFQEFRYIRLAEIADVEHLLTPEQLAEPVTLRTPATEAMTDFAEVLPVTVAETALVDVALERMKSQHVRLLFAVNDAGHFTGVITARDIAGSKPLAYAEQNGLDRGSVEVRHIMLNKLHLKALTYDQIKDATIGDVMLTLKGSGDQHVLVTDVSLADVRRVRGIISASDISRRLKVGFDVMYEAKSFAEIEKIVAHGGEL